MWAAEIKRTYSMNWSWPYLCYWEKKVVHRYKRGKYEVATHYKYFLGVIDFCLLLRCSDLILTLFLDGVVLFGFNFISNITLVCFTWNQNIWYYPHIYMYLKSLINLTSYIKYASRWSELEHTDRNCAFNNCMLISNYNTPLPI